MNKDLARTFISSHYRDTAVRLVIRGNKLYFLRKSKHLRRNCLIITNSDGYDKHTVLEPDTDKGYDLGILSQG